VLEGTRTGLKAVGHLLRHRDLRARPPVDPPATDDGRRERWLHRLAGPPLSAAESLTLLADYGLPVAETIGAVTGDGARRAAARVGYPVALKTDDPAVAHKSDAGGVRLGVQNETELAAAYAEMSRRLGPAVSVSAMVGPGVELALGVVRDEQMGPLVLVAAGGVLVEVLSDRALAVPPLDRLRASALLDGLTVRPLLDGVRGRPACDLDAVARAVVALSVLAAELGDAVEAIDVNPLVCGPSGAVAVDCLVVPRQS
jgi:acyl-CoA synthetase (NDP forming)